MVSVFLLLTLALAPTAGAEGVDGDDTYIRGYAGAVLQREFDVSAAAVSVQDGVVTIAADLSEPNLEKVRNVLMHIEGVREVRIAEADSRPRGLAWLPRRTLFRAPIADPRWPRFSASYQRYINDHELKNVAAVSFGETIPLAKYNPEYGGSWDIALQGGVFAIFDLDGSSFDLINADYLGGLPVTYAIGDLAVMGRFFHQSSHLGDEFLLGNTVERVNFSYEAFSLLGSYDLPLGFRVYGGGAYRFRIEPSDVRPWRFQAGAEWVGPSISDEWAIRPLAAIDVQVDEEGNWSTNTVPALGLQFERARSQGRVFQLLVEYFNGKSPNGQFYARNIQYAALTGQFQF
jgi:hypothetical protein